MRTLYLYLSIITCLIIGACHNDKVEPLQNELLTGTWIAELKTSHSQTWVSEYTFTYWS